MFYLFFFVSFLLLAVCRQRDAYVLFSLSTGGLEYIQHRYISLNSHDFLNFLFTLITTEQRTFLKCFADSLSLLCVFPYTIIIHFKFLKCFRTATLHYFYDYFYGYGVNWMISKMHCLYARKIYTLSYLYEFSLLYHSTPYHFLVFLLLLLLLVFWIQYGCAYTQKERQRRW